MTTTGLSSNHCTTFTHALDHDVDHQLNQPNIETASSTKDLALMRVDSAEHFMMLEGLPPAEQMDLMQSIL